jgi:hypothetical protein
MNTQTGIIKPESLITVITSEKRNKGGNFTLRGRKTNKDFTYKISRSEFCGKWYTHVYVETQYLNFKHLGYYRNGNIYKGSSVVNSDAANGIAWLLRQIEKGDLNKLNEQAELFHTGKCLKCRRELTDAHSIETGLGPVCNSVYNINNLIKKS